MVPRAVQSPWSSVEPSIYFRDDHLPALPKDGSEMSTLAKTDKPVSVAVPLAPTLISEFNNSGLRESVAKALDGVPSGHGHALLQVDSKGAGVMLVQKFDDRWALVAAFRFDRKEGGKAQAAVQVSW